jgi:hypothetical protein
MGLVSWESDPEIPEKHSVVGSLLTVSGTPRSFAIANRKFTIRNRIARVAKLADTPGLGFRNHRFQDVTFHFKANAFYEWKTGFSYEILVVSNGE